MTCQVPAASLSDHCNRAAIFRSAHFRAAGFFQGRYKFECRCSFFDALFKQQPGNFWKIEIQEFHQKMSVCRLNESLKNQKTDFDSWPGTQNFDGEC